MPLIVFPSWRESTKRYYTWIPKNWRHNLPCRWNSLPLLWSRFYSFSPLFRLFFVSNVRQWTNVSFMVMNRLKNGWNKGKTAAFDKKKFCFIKAIHRFTRPSLRWPKSMSQSSNLKSNQVSSNSWVIQFINNSAQSNSNYWYYFWDRPRI